jgi:hypothetical protein
MGIGVNVGGQAIFNPTTMFIWQQPEWLMSAWDAEPNQETTWVHRSNANDTGAFVPVTPPVPAQPTVFQVTDTIVKNAILSAIQYRQAQDAQAPLLKEIEELRQKVSDLQKQINDLNAQSNQKSYDAQAILDRATETPEAKAAVQASNQSYYADKREISAELRDQVEDDARLGALIDQLAKSAGAADLSKEAREVIMKRVREYVAQITKNR